MSPKEDEVFFKFRASIQGSHLSTFDEIGVSQLFKGD